MTICSWDSIYGLLNNYFCRKSADYLRMEFWIADCLQNICRKSADYLQMEFWIAEYLQKKCRFLQMEFWIAEYLPKKCRDFADFSIFFECADMRLQVHICFPRSRLLHYLIFSLRLFIINVYNIPPKPHDISI